MRRIALTMTLLAGCTAPNGDYLGGVVDAGADAMPPAPTRPCPSATAPIHDPSTGVCRPCASDAECAEASPANPLCAPTGACVACRSGSDCPSMVCASNACVVPSMLVFVSVKQCPAAGVGTLESPFCRVQDGLDTGARMQKRVVVLPGTYKEQLQTNPQGGSYKVSALGIQSPVIAGNGATGPVVRVTAGASDNVDVTFDGFHFEGGRQAAGDGLWCVGNNASTTKVTLLRSTVAFNDRYGLFASYCTVTLDQDVIGPENAQGGVYTSLADFTMSNLLVVKNGTPGAAGSDFGGLHLEMPASTSSLVNATIVGNAGNGSFSPGLYCSGTPTIFNVVATGNTASSGSMPEVGSACGASYSGYPGASALKPTNVDTASCTSSDLFVDPTMDDYHPRLQSSCSLAGRGTSQIAGVTAPAYDLTGEVRPTTRPIDIGAFVAK